MAPSAFESKVVVTSEEFPKPFKSSGALDKYVQVDVTPAIRTELPTVKLIN